jgi:S-DNA-T family DNA segregation ATPase FtsK/SpoIIIE
VHQPVAWEGDLAVVGPRPSALGAARGIVLAALASDPGISVALRTDRPDDWSWLAWFAQVTVGPPGREPGVPGPESGASGRECGAGGVGGRSSLVVLDGAPAVVAGDHRVLAIAPTPPPWGAAVLAVDGRRARLVGADGRSRAVPPVGVSAAVADALARALAARPPDGPAIGCPADVALGELPGVLPPDPATIARHWRRSTDGTGTQPGTSPAPRPTLATPIGASSGGAPVVVDLVRDGPHAIVAGTTGSGKSESAI